MSRSAFGGVANLGLATTRQERTKARRIQVHKSLLNVVLLDQLPDHISEKVSSCYPARERGKNGNPGDSFLTQ
jgi:hypothetical protein